MTESHKNIYIQQRAKVIKYFQDTRNGHYFNGHPYCMSMAIKIAESQLNCDLKAGELRITLEELLSLSDEECISLVQSRVIEKAKRAIN